MATKKTKTDGGTSLWERLDRPATPRPSLTPHKIASTAVEIADAEGLDAITMRRLAAAMGTAPMAAYRYVSGKDDVLQLMGDFVYAEIEISDGTTGWRDTLRDHAVRTRELVLRHPWLTQLPPEAALTPSPHRLVIVESSLAALDGLGLDADTRMAVVRSIDAYVQGAVNSEVAVIRMMEGQGWKNGDEVRQGLAPEMTHLMKTQNFPAMQTWAQTAERKDDRAWQFATGLECMLDGVATRYGI
ncbi:TetR family transcriptional regulator [Rhodococcus sp. SRB_17]|nr:TetR family transcriptional regulator [Rhodococcus sp. SRB_17]